MSEYQDWRKSLEPMVAALSAQFQTKNISEVTIFARHSDTGVIDANKLAMYRTSDKIFKSEKTVPEGKKSGFIMALDLSSSMRGKLKQVFTQTAALMLFAKRNSIPFEVYGFSDSETTKSLFSSYHNNGYRSIDLSDDIQSDGGNVSLFRLEASSPIRLFASGKVNLEKAIEGFFVAFCESFGSVKSLQSYVMGGTPMASMIYALDKVISSFKARNPKIHHPVVIILSDGQDTSSSMLIVNQDKPYYSYKKIEKTQIVWGKAMITVEPIERYNDLSIKKCFADSRSHCYSSYDGKDVSSKVGWLLDLLRQRHSDCRFIGYFVYTSPKTLPGVFKDIFNDNLSTRSSGYGRRKQLYFSSQEQEDNHMFFKKVTDLAKDNGFFKLNNVHGYDSLFFISIFQSENPAAAQKLAKKTVTKSGKGKIEADQIDNMVKTMVSIMDNASARRVQKRFINDFIEAIASEPERGIKGKILS